ncbi:response regulator [Frankia sp. AgB32]|uniref:response regulator n=1 Tax=Frankia sp. AgB32 TaxID=631119 RepID=UPI00200DAB0D|nr:response regulator [Frankia sp. AgB32]MCK9897635.1 response regulator [Frankia sp. AgB32]
MNAQAVGPSAGSADGPPGEAGPRVLVVDDNEMLRSLLARVLGGEGFQVSTAGSVEEALRLDPAAHDVVLVDLRLGGRPGTDLVDELRQAEPGAADRCILLTGGLGLDPVPADLPVVTKPFTADSLVAAVRRTLVARRAGAGQRTEDRDRGTGTEPR